MSKLGADTYLLNKEFPEYPVGTIYQDISTLFDDGEVDFYTKTEDGWVFSHRSSPQLFLYENNRTEKNQYKRKALI